MDDGRKIRVLVVEDSATVRAHLCAVLNGDPGIELVGVAADGQRAIELTRELRPDLITLDMMLPTLNGLAVTEYVMAHHPTPILVVSSSVNRGELFTTYDALAAGAVDVLEKPTGAERDGTWERKLIAAVKLVSRIRVITHPRGRLGAFGRPRSEPPTAVVARPEPGHSSECEVVAIGASTGGPGAIVEILHSLPRSFSIPVLLVLHMAEPFGTVFVEWLDGQTPRSVRYASDGMPVSSLPGEVIMAPPGHHLRVERGRLRLTQEPERHSCRPSVDVLFESVATAYGPTATACLLTGMGRDGAAGLLVLRQAGGLTIAQDEATSVVYGMPGEAVHLGAAHWVLPIDAIGPMLASLPGSDAWRGRP